MGRTTIEERRIMMNMHELGFSTKLIQKCVHHISARTVRKIIARGGNLVKTGEKRGRPKKTTANEDKILVDMMKESNTRKPKEVAIKFNKRFNRAISNRLIRRRMVSIRARYHRIRRAPRLTVKHISNRLNFCETYKIFDWSRVIFSDETTIELGSKSEFKWEFEDENLVTSVDKFPTKQMFWACFDCKGQSSLVPITGTLNGERYKRLLSHHLSRFICHVPSRKRSVFQQDNARPHISKIVRTWFIKNKVRTLWWPPNSPDLNPIENLWGSLKQAVWQRMPKNRQQLIRFAQEEWNSISAEKLISLVNSMPRRVDQVQERQGLKCDY